MVKGTGSKFNHTAPKGWKKAAHKAANRRSRKYGKPAQLMAAYRNGGADAIAVVAVSVGYY